MDKVTLAKRNNVARMRSQTLTPVFKEGFLTVTKKVRDQKYWFRVDLNTLWWFSSDKAKVSNHFYFLSHILNATPRPPRADLQVFTKEQNYILQAESDDERDAWVKSILLAKQQQQTDQQSYQHATSEKQIKYRILDIQKCSADLLGQYHAAVFDQRLWIHKNEQDIAAGKGVCSVDLRGAKVQRIPGKSDIFELKTPDISLSFAANSSDSVSEWCQLLENSISGIRTVNDILQQVWSACPGLHKELGHGFSKLHNLHTEHELWTEDITEILCTLGNNEAVKCWCGQAPLRRKFSISNPLCLQNIQAKYHRWCPPNISQEKLTEELHETVKKADLAQTLNLLIAGARALPSVYASALLAGQDAQAALIDFNIDDGNFMEPPWQDIL
uniref:arf-GAP with Rho-GAP domain, ANK repeat and PH domain-containing protein 1-like isoform X2 n=1 Tax=Myxine glutinosa TaxID=7769 RepID=UPI00358E96B4